MAVTVKGTIYDGVRGAKVEFGTLTYNPASLLTVAEAEGTIAFDGVAAGDLIFVTPRALTAGLVCKGARVTASDVVGITVANFSTGTVDGGEITYDYVVVKFGGDA